MGPLVLIEERLESELSGFLATGRRGAVIGEIEHHQVHPPGVRLLNLRPDLLRDHADRAPPRVQLHDIRSRRPGRLGRGYRWNDRGRICRVEKRPDAGEQQDQRNASREDLPEHGSSANN
jgi:hypothetical protein